jgi:AsmA protein
MLKDRKAGDAVRSAIERITGSGKRPTPAESPTAENAKETVKDNAKSN